MVLPDGTGSESKQKQARRTTLFLGAGVLVVAGFLAMGALTSTQSISVGVTSTTMPTSTTLGEVEPPIDADHFTIDQVARGQPLNWQSAGIMDKGLPLALFDHDEWLYLFGGEDGFTVGDGAAVRGWRSRDGLSWESLGQVFSPDQAITSISSTPRGLAAVDFDTESSSLIVRWSSDGASWASESVPVDDLDQFATFYTTAVGASKDVFVVSANLQVDAAGIVESRLGTDIDLQEYGFGVEVTGDDIQLLVYGPLGFPLASLSTDDLRLTRDEVERIIELNNQASSNFIWARTSDGTWRQTDIPDAQWIDWLIGLPDGGVVAQGYGPAGYAAWVTHDGISWEPTAGYTGPYRLDDWGDRLVGSSTNGGTSLLASNEDGTWENIGPGSLFPTALDWGMGVTAAGPGGVAAMVSGWDRSPDELPRPEPVTITRDGATLSLDLYDGSFGLETADGGKGSWSMTGATPKGIEVDLESGNILFNDPVSGEFLASFTIEEINDAQNEYYSAHDFDRGYEAFVFSPDGSNWTIQDTSTIGPDVSIWLLEVTDSRVIAAGVDAASLTSADLSPAFAVWSAAIP